MPLPGKYNVQVGGGFYAFNHPDQLKVYQEKLSESQPFVVIHYTTSSKPWKMLSVNAPKLRDIWWQYRTMDYIDLLQHKPLPDVGLPAKQASLFCFTNSEDLHGISELAKALPNYEFHVAAYSLFGFHLIEDLKYPNIKLHPTMTPFVFNEMLKDSAAYLDINYGSKDQGIIQQFIDQGKPVLAFPDTVTNELKDNRQYRVIPDLQTMTNLIQKLN